MMRLSIRHLDRILLKPTIGILGMGDMGSAVGRVMRQAGYRVVTALAERSALSRRLAANAEVEDLGSLSRLFGESDIFLSILPPAAAFDFAAAVSRLSAPDRRTAYVDCNAVSPVTVNRIANVFAPSRFRFIDVGIVGPAPKAGSSSPTRFYVSGEHRESILGLAIPEISMIDMGDRIGRASAIKMCYAAMNKGVNALLANLVLAARDLGVLDELLAELETSQPDAARRIKRRVPFLASAAGRYTGEMAEIAATFDAAGVSGDFYRGAEWLYALLASSALGSESRATEPAERALDDALDVFAAAIEARARDKAKA